MPSYYVEMEKAWNVLFFLNAANFYMAAKIKMAAKFKMVVKFNITVKFNMAAKYEMAIELPQNFLDVLSMLCSQNIYIFLLILNLHFSY